MLRTSCLMESYFPLKKKKRQQHFDFSYFLRDALNTSSLLLHLTQSGVIHGQQNVCITCA
jgi:hypothetical protein